MRKTNKPRFTKENMQSSTDVFRALAHPLRMKILAYIDQEKFVNVNTIYSELGLEQSVTSQHLRILRNSGLVLPQRRGKFIFYIVDYDKVAYASKAAEIMSDFAPLDAELDDFDEEDLSEENL